MIIEADPVATPNSRRKRLVCSLDLKSEYIYCGYNTLNFKILLNSINMIFLAPLINSISFMLSKFNSFHYVWLNLTKFHEEAAFWIWKNFILLSVRWVLKLWEVFLGACFRLCWFRNSFHNLRCSRIFKILLNFKKSFAGCLVYDEIMYDLRWILG